MAKICPYCGSRMVGEIGFRVCSNMNCRAYEVDTTDPESYNKPLSQKEYKERKKRGDY